MLSKRFKETRKLKKWLFCDNPHQIKPVAIICLLIMIATTGRAQVGGDAGTFLNLSSGARAYGLGGAGLSITDDASAIFVNPGMLGIQTDVQLNATLARLKFDRRYFDFAFIYPYGSLGNFAIGWTQMGVDDIPGRDQNEYITQNFSDLQNAFVLGYGRMIGDMFSLGLTGKFLYHSLWGYAATGAGLDLGIALYLGDHLTIGGAVKNINSSIKWNTDSQLKETFPTLIGAGVAYYNPFNVQGLMLTGDYSLVGGSNSTYGIGTEYIFKDLLIARAGYCRDGLTFGGGIMYGAFKLDCGYTPEKFSDGARLHFTFNWLISPSETAAAPETETFTPPQTAPASPTIYQESTTRKQMVLIMQGPLKSEQAEVIRVDQTNQTVTVRLISLPGSEPITLNLDQVKFLE